MSFVIKDDDVSCIKCNEIQDKIKETLSITFHSTPVYDEKYRKPKVREFNHVIKTNFLSDEVPKENEHQTCMMCNYCFCCENGKEKLYAGLYRRMQIQNEKDKNNQIHRS